MRDGGERWKCRSVHAPAPVIVDVERGVPAKQPLDLVFHQSGALIDHQHRHRLVRSVAQPVPSHHDQHLTALAADLDGEVMHGNSRFKQVAVK